MMLERAGAQTGALEYQLTNRAPDAASASMWGVFRSVAPRQPRSWQPRSSATMRIKLGWRDTAAGSKAGAAPATINSRRVMGIALVYDGELATRTTAAPRTASFLSAFNASFACSSENICTWVRTGISLEQANEALNALKND